MASTDSLEDVTAFATLNEANFPILSDPDKKVARAYGALGIIGYAKRWTFYIDREGIIQHIDKSVNPATAGPDLASNLDSLGYSKSSAD
jgi:peroxiredoxin Q/BCP